MAWLHPVSSWYGRIYNKNHIYLNRETQKNVQKNLQLKHWNPLDNLCCILVSAAECFHSVHIKAMSTAFRSITWIPQLNTLMDLSIIENQFILPITKLPNLQGYHYKSSRCYEWIRHCCEWKIPVPFAKWTYSLMISSWQPLTRLHTLLLKAARLVTTKTE